MKKVDELIDGMVNEKRIVVAKKWNHSWGTRDYCMQLFRHIFEQVDHTFVKYEHLPEYDEIIDWMTYTDGKGLMLMGDCGRGKSVVITRIIPVLMRMYSRQMLYPVHASEFSKTYPFAMQTENYNPNATNLEYLTRISFPIIDELGVEPMMNDYGEKCEGFNVILNAAERFQRPVFVTTNLTEVQILDRYGERTMDRLAHLCRTIHFEGESLRK